MTYLALFEPAEDGGYVITFPDFGYGVTQAESDEEGIELASDLLACLISDAIESGNELPKPKRYRGRKSRPIHLHALVSVKAEVYSAFLPAGIRKAELARRLNIPKANIDRLFDVRHSSRIEHLEAAFRAIGMEMSIDIKRAA